jgi:hypothetical protein
LQTVVKYQVGYGQYPNPFGEGTVIVPVPWQLVSGGSLTSLTTQWSNHQQQLFRVGNHLASIAWACLLWINAEEVVFWLYLFSTITRRQSKAWFSSWYFKVWVIVGVLSSGSMIGITQIDSVNLLKVCWSCSGC